MKQKSDIEKEMHHRTELLLGEETMGRISDKCVIIFGIGGVGSWCAESLVRSGIKHLTIVDSDEVSISNCNRQLMATTKTIGQPKVEVLRERLLELNPKAEIKAIQRRYDATTAESFMIEEYDYVIDAIDSLRDKARLILHATGSENVKLFSSMGAALRIDPFKVRKAEFWDIKGDALARAIRNTFKKDKTFPKHKFYCVYSEETPLSNRSETNLQTEEKTNIHKTQINGSISHVTGIFGLALAGMVIEDITKND